MRDVAVVAFAQSKYAADNQRQNEIEILMPVVREAVEQSGIAKRDIGFTVSGSCDYLTGMPFSFVTALDAVGAWPPIEESHVEMDGAWALYEAWVRLQHGDVDSALVYSFGKSSLGALARVLSNQLNPYYLMPLWPDAVSLAGLQARALLDAGACTETEMAEAAVRSRRHAKANPRALPVDDAAVDELLAAPYVAQPLRAHDCAPSADGAAAVVLAADDLAKSVRERPAWIRGIDHRIDPHMPGVRELTTSPSARLAGEKAGAAAGGFDVAELHAAFTHEEILLRRELGLTNGTAINPSGGAFAGNAFMVAGLARIGEAARRIHDGTAKRVLAHAASGPCLQQNLVCVMEAA